MEDMKEKYKEVIEQINGGSRFMVVSHVNPEGDAIGSLLGLALALRNIGKDAVAYMEDPMPDLFRFMPGGDTIVHDLSNEAPFDATFAVDCGQKERLGERFNEFASHGTLVNIDHHATNDSFGDVNVVQGDASAAGEMVFDLLRAAGIEITKDVAINLYVAIHTDTGCFRYSCSTPGAFKKAGELVELGADPWEISTYVYENQPLDRYKLLAMSLATLTVINDGDIKVASLDVTQEMLEKVEGSGSELADGFVNFARSISDVEVGILFRENSPGFFKMSMRSKGKVDVAALAASFGGGGHRNAAGFCIEAPLDEVKAKVKEAISKQLKVA
ncbi:MAG: bifunctional oligoribonuclease/PAP phosphatase NrnA [Thermodesulfobacteriota bacterium]